MSKTGITRQSLLHSDGTALQNSVLSRLLMRRMIDKIATHFIGLGGVSIILAVMLIFVFLFSEIVPMFTSAKVKQVHSGVLTGLDARLIAVDSDDRGELLMQLVQRQDESRLILSPFAKNDSTTEPVEIDLAYSAGVEWVYDPVSGYYIVEDAGVVHFGVISEKEIYPEDSKRIVKPDYEQLSPDAGFTLADADAGEYAEIRLLQLKALSNAIALSYIKTDLDGNKATFLQVWTKSRSFMGSKSVYKPKAVYELPVTAAPQSVYIDNQLSWAYAIDELGVDLIRLKDGGTLHSRVENPGGI